MAYTGSDATFHYYVTSYMLERKRYYAVKLTDYTMPQTIERTQDKSAWVPYVHDLGQGKDYFRFRE